MQESSNARQEEAIRPRPSGALDEAGIRNRLGDFCLVPYETHVVTLSAADGMAAVLKVLGDPLVPVHGRSIAFAPRFPGNGAGR